MLDFEIFEDTFRIIFNSIEGIDNFMTILNTITQRNYAITISSETGRIRYFTIEIKYLTPLIVNLIGDYDIICS